VSRSENDSMKFFEKNFNLKLKLMPMPMTM
jgi:hypothetical protein